MIEFGLNTSSVDSGHRLEHQAILVWEPVRRDLVRFLIGLDNENSASNNNDSPRLSQIAFHCKRAKVIV